MMDRENRGSVGPWGLANDLDPDRALETSGRRTQRPVGTDDPDVSDDPTSRMDTLPECGWCAIDQQDRSESGFGRMHTYLQK